ncbi:hypothetical protein ACWC5I_02045 [Kitasatospora sp. NPDC001574]
MVPNAAARHDQLPLAAVGLLVRLLSLPDGASATIEKITGQVAEGKTAVASAFRQLENAGYLRRERVQDPETGKWSTQSHVSDLPMDRIPAVGGPAGRTVGDLPEGERNGEKNLLPTPAAVDGEPQASDSAVVASAPEGETQANPADAELVGRAASILAKLAEHDRRLALGTADVLRLAPLASEWLAEGHSPLKVLSVLTVRLPERIDAPAALVGYRLANHRPAVPVSPVPAKAPKGDTRARCVQCGAVFRAGIVQDLCKSCTSEEARLDEPLLVGDEAAGLLASIRERRASGTFAKGARSRFLPTAA